MRLRRVLTLLSCLLLSTACACTELPTTMASPQPQLSATPSPHVLPPLQVTPETVAAQLQAAANLQSAAEQMAATLQIPVDQIQVRIRSKDCLVCNLAESGAQGPPPLSVSEAATQLEAYDLFWFSVQTLTCAYYFDGDTVTPRSCQIE